jgi:hypothetical protein
MNPRLMLPAVALLSASFALAGCSGGSSGGTTTTPAPVVMSRAQANSIAARVNLAAANLPGYTSAPDTLSAKDKAQNAALSKCIGTTPPSEALIDAYSRNFAKGPVLISSEFEVVSTTKDVQHDLVAIKQAKARRCISEQLNQELAPHGLTHIVTSFTTIPVSKAGTNGVFGLNATIRFTEAGTRRQLIESQIGLARANVELSLDITNGSTTPIPAALITKLRNALVQRLDQKVPAAGLTLG